MNYDMENKAELQELIEEISLNETEQALLAQRPQILNELWDEVRKATFLKHLQTVILAQIMKAEKGDTASAKFLVDFVSELGESHNLASHQDAADWEADAIALRNKLGIELSAEVLVKTLLRSLIAYYTVDFTLGIMNSSSPPLPNA